jgi:hypothetical protein
MKKYNYHCNSCGEKLVKNGRNRNGKQRWKCKVCLCSKIDTRDDLSKRYQLTEFVDWLLDKKTVAQSSSVSRWTFARKTKWCWNIDPVIPKCKKNHDIILIDATYIHRGNVVLIARSPEYTVDFTWAGYESKYSWERLISRIPEPKFVITDGNPGALSAIQKYWPNARIQRCTFHLFLFVRAKLSLKPKTQAGKELLDLSKMMHHIRYPDRAIDWCNQLYAWRKRWDEFLNEVTISETAKTATGRRKRWYTHRNLRAAYKHLENAVKDDQIFCYIGEDIPNTTNYMEGGINARLKELRRCHRGISIECERKLFGWYLVSRSENGIKDLIKKSTQNAP